MSRTAGATARLRSRFPAAAVALAGGLAAVGGSYLAVGRRPAFVAAPVDRFVLAVSPDALVTFAITKLGPLGHRLAFLTAIALTCLFFGLAILPGVALHRGRVPLDGVPVVRDAPVVAGPLVGTVLAGAIALGLTGAPASSAGAAAGAGLVLLVAAGTARLAGDRDAAFGRRRVLGAVGSAIGLSALGFFVHGSGEKPSPSGLDVPEDVRSEVRELLAQAKERSLAVEGLKPLVSTDFYEVDINNVNPDVDREEWSLSITGAVEKVLN